VFATDPVLQSKAGKSAMTRGVSYCAAGGHGPQVGYGISCVVGVGDDFGTEAIKANARTSVRRMIFFMAENPFPV